MPSIELNTPELMEFLDNKFTLNELKERIPMIGVDMECIDEEKIVVEIFPNRPDMLSVEGFSRALKGFLEIEQGPVKYEVKNSDVSLTVSPSVKDVRPYIASAIVKNVNFNENFLVSLMNLQEKLHVTHGRNRKKVAIGVHDFEKIQPPFTYKTVKYDEIKFVPLDMNIEMNLKEILQKHPKGTAYADIFDGISDYPIILDKNNNVVSFPPIINGELTRVTKSTKNLFIEITGTGELAVRQALNIVVSAIADRGGEIYSVLINQTNENYENLL